jgi:hypothetical protein
MFEQSLDIFHFFIFIIPGFVTVWVFRFFADSGKLGEFEYFASSCLWGVLLLAIYEFLCLIASARPLIANLLQNPYSAASVLALLMMAFLGFFLGWCGSIFVKTKKFKALAGWLKSFNFNLK